MGRPRTALRSPRARPAGRHQVAAAPSLLLSIPRDAAAGPSVGERTPPMSEKTIPGHIPLPAVTRRGTPRRGRSRDAIGRCERSRLACSNAVMPGTGRRIPGTRVRPHRDPAAFPRPCDHRSELVSSWPRPVLLLWRSSADADGAPIVEKENSRPSRSLLVRRDSAASFALCCCFCLGSRNPVAPCLGRPSRGRFSR